MSRVHVALIGLHDSIAEVIEDWAERHPDLCVGRVRPATESQWAAVMRPELVVLPSDERAIAMAYHARTVWQDATIIMIDTAAGAERLRRLDGVLLISPSHLLSVLSRTIAAIRRRRQSLAAEQPVPVWRQVWERFDRQFSGRPLVRILLVANNAVAIAIFLAKASL